VRPPTLPHWLESALGSVPARLARAIAETPSPDGRLRPIPIRMLRSTFRRADETLTCELALNDELSCYEFRTSGAAPPGLARNDKLCTAVEAFERQSAIETALLADGWTLESHESFLA
jgi:hypothetical protein